MIALLPMKGHSERIPNKNIRKLVDKPLFYHVLETLTKCDKIEVVIINTDSEQIADLATSEFKEHVQISWRPESLLGDMVSMNKIFKI